MTPVNLKLFSSEDFDSPSLMENEHYADIANSKLVEWIRGSAIVYGHKDSKGYISCWNWEGDKDDNVRARVVCLEKIPVKCKHSGVPTDFSSDIYKCVNCGIILKPTGWKAAE